MKQDIEIIKAKNAQKKCYDSIFPYVYCFNNDDCDYGVDIEKLKRIYLK